MQKPPLILLVVGILLVVASVVVGWLIIPDAVRGAMENRLRLLPGTNSWKRWLEPTEKTDIFIKFYIFNTTNPTQVKKGQRPILRQFGPYVYTEKRVKTEVTINQQNGTVSYRPIVHYFFRPDLSIGDQSDVYTILNAPHVIMTSLAAKRPDFEQSIFQFAVLNPHPEEDLFVERSVDQILFGGWHVSMSQSLEETAGRAAFKNHTFGFYFPKNGSSDSVGVFEVTTGDGGNLAEFGKVVSWKGQSQLDYWPAKSACNRINGSDGSIFPPFVTRQRTVRVFSPELCRSIYLTFEGETEVNKILGYRFILPPKLFEDPHLNVENACFCSEKDGSQGSGGGNCLKSGVMSMSACKRGAPIVMSSPHFLYGDPEYIDQAPGMEPDPEKHSTFLDLEPNTGLLLRGHKRIQLNIHLTRNDLSELYAEVPDMIYPVLWMDETSTMGEETAARVQSLVLEPLRNVQIGRWVALGVSLLVVVAGIGYAVRAFLY